MEEQIRIQVTDAETVSGVYAAPDDFEKGGKVAVFAHGAANDMNNPLIVAVADGFVKAGYGTLRFNFCYREKGKDSIDGQGLLEKAWRRAVETVQEKAAPEEIIGVGKSLGARIGSMMVSAGKLPVNRLIFLGYPLHAPGKKDRLRDEHLYGIEIPMLFFAGTKDPFADIDLLKGVVDRLPAGTLEIVENGGHSLERSDMPQEAVYRNVIDRCFKWL